MRPAFAVLAAALLATALTATPAAADPTDPGPTNVQISWKDDTFQHVHVSWDEEGAQPNKIILRWPGGKALRAVYVTADAPNEVDLAATTLAPYEGALEIGVAAGTEAGETSPVVASAPFDTIEPGLPSLVSFTMSGASTLSVKWKSLPPFQTDTTPDDPLDRTDSVRYTTWYSLSTAGEKVEVTKPSTATESTFTGTRAVLRLRGRRAQ